MKTPLFRSFTLSLFHSFTMKAYNEIWIRNREILRQTEGWHRSGLVSDGQLAKARMAFPFEFHQTSGFVEVGLFIFTVVTAGGSYLLLASIFGVILGESPFAYQVFNLAFGVGAALLNGRLIQHRKFYRSGVDNALIAVSATLICFGLVGLLPDQWPFWAYCFALLPILLAAVVYYGDLLLVMATFAILVTGVVGAMLDLPGGKTILPFVGMALAGLLYWLGRRNENRETLFYWRDNLVLLQWLSLGLLLINSNYFVVRQTNYWLLETALPEPPQIALPGLFWALTFGIPAGMLWMGIRQKERPLIIMGVVGALAALTTLRYYERVFSIETYVMAVGGLLILTAVLLIRRLRTPRSGYSDTPEALIGDSVINPETLAVVQAASQTLPPDRGMQFGEGDFGGGGSGEKY